jgi:hypothetical protein
MHRYREFGLVSEQDETLRRAFRDGFRRAGLSFAQFLDALAWYRDHGRQGGATGADEAQLADAFARFAADRGWPTEQRDGALDLYRAIRDGGPDAAVETPHPDADRATLARADELLRTDPTRYWDDAELQDAAFEARERLSSASVERRPDGGDGAASADAERIAEAHGGETPPLRGPDPHHTDRQRIAEVEALLRDPGGDGQRRYWSDAALRTGYAEALTRVHGGEASEGS